MRLIELRLKNLNSLKGEWHMDFSDKAFVDEGIFAITGQTGAGKTTILDAICLALYGETPRINSISKNSNEVMTRQTGDCFAEVVIELNGAQYRCRWGQRRAYGKPDGNLQDATHEVAKVNLEDPDKGDEILEEKLSRTKDKIVELTSMDFQQFTRSILLAQGSFSAFLKAKSDERADILEKITGTEIYADISKNVHEKHRVEKEELQRLQAVTDSLALLDTDTEKEYRETIDTFKTELNTKKAKLTDFEAQLKWLSDIEHLETQLNQFNRQLGDAEQAKLAFKIDAERLDKANTALEINQDYNLLNTYRQTLKTLQADKQATEEQLSKQRHELIQNQADLDVAIVAEQTSNTDYNQAQPLIAETRQLDVQIAQHQQRLTDKQTRQNQLNLNIENIQRQLTSHDREQQQVQDKLDEAQRYLASHQHHANLTSDIETFKQLGLQATNLLQNNEAKAKQRLEAHTTLSQLTDKLSKLEAIQVASSEKIDTEKLTLNTLKQQQNNLLQGQTLKGLRLQQSDIDQSTMQLNSISTQLQQLQNVASQASETHALLPDMQSNIDASEQLLLDNQRQLKTLVSERQDKETNLNLLQQVAKLENFIHLLEDDKPCPLCGSIEHPYSDNHPLLSEASSKQSSSTEQSPVEQINNRLAELKEQIEILETTITDEKIKLATAKNELERSQQQLGQQLAQVKQLITENTALTTALEESLKNLSLPINALFDDHDLIAQLDTTQSTWLDSFKVDENVSAGDLAHLTTKTVTLSEHIQMTKQALVTKRNELDNLLDNNDKLTQDITQTEHKIQSLEGQAQSSVQEISDTKTNIKLTTQQIDNDSRYINANFAELNNVIDAISNLATIYKEDGFNNGNNKDYSNNVTSLNDSLEQFKSSNDSQQVLNNAEYEPHITALRDHCKWLQTLRKRYDEYTHSSQTLGSKVSNIVTQINGLKHQLNDQQNELNTLTEDIKLTAESLNGLQDKRQTLYQDKDMDAEEKRLRLALDTAKEVLSQARQRYSITKQRLAQLAEQGTKLDKDLVQANTKVAEQQAIFTTLLKDNNFADEHAFVSALLERDVREALATQKQKINSDLQTAINRLKETKEQLQQKRATPLVNDDIDETTLEAQSASLEGEIAELNRKIGAIEQRLKTNDDNKKQLQVQLKAIETQKETLNLWSNLHKLIGSADGKKYRTFAQGLTFEMMVANANTQLQKMSDRYLLIRDEDNPLELNVIDNYQAGEIRSTKNLSGGEGFIISLALALGLSNMASQNIRVDSLFLDEGFGTLDEDSLDVALNTLTNLQQEGKLIGIISHVQALKDRIHTQIRVDKLSGGYSKISGPGCLAIKR